MTHYLYKDGLNVDQVKPLSTGKYSFSSDTSDKWFDDIKKRYKTSTDRTNSTFYSTSFNKLQELLKVDLENYRDTEKYWKNNFSIKNNSSSGYDEYIERKEKERYKKLENEFIFLINHDEIEIGSYTQVDKFLEDSLTKDNLITQNILSEIFKKHYTDISFLCKFLLLISRVPPSKIQSVGHNIAMAALNHKNDEVKEYALRVFETFADHDALDFLIESKEDIFWIQDYKEEIIEDIRAKFKK